MPGTDGRRTILHCDCNNYFASVELLEHPELQDKPVAVAGDPEGRHGIILAKNMPAKKAGVKTAEAIWQARQKCPDLVLLPPHHEKYAAMSQRINGIYLEVTDQVEPFSVDESFLDVTGSRSLFGDGVTIADMLRKRIREELGITISVGVSDNKTWAKMGSDYKKPDATTLITRDNVREILYPLPVEDFLFVGRSAAEVLRRHGIATVGALADASPALLTKLLGKQGASLWEAANGLDISPVRHYGEVDEPKSVGKGETFPYDLTTEEELQAGLLPLCHQVASRLRAHGLKCRLVTLQIKDAAFHVISRQKILPIATNQAKEIYGCACQILRANWPKGKAIRMLTVTAGNLCHVGDEESVQMSLLEEAPLPNERQQRMEETLDVLRKRFGKEAVRAATPRIGRRDEEEKGMEEVRGHF